MPDYATRYREAMDYVREEFNLPVSVGMYEAVVTVTEAYRRNKDLKSLKTGETTNGKRKPGRPRKSSRSK